VAAPAGAVSRQGRSASGGGGSRGAATKAAPPLGQPPALGVLFAYMAGEACGVPGQGAGSWRRIADARPAVTYALQAISMWPRTLTPLHAMHLQATASIPFALVHAGVPDLGCDHSQSSSGDDGARQAVAPQPPSLPLTGGA
jgi:hypothetical protein